MNAGASDIKVKMWSPAVPCKIPDNIVSSQFSSMKVFTPSYEKEKRPCIEQLLTNEYQRIWWQEKEVWEKRHSSKITTKKLLQRMVIRRKPTAVPVIEKPKKPRKPRKKKELKKEDTDEKSKKDIAKEPEEDKQVKDTIQETVEKKEDDKDEGTA